MPQDPSCEALKKKVEALEKEAADWKHQLELKKEEELTAQKYLDIAGVIIVAINTRGEITLINRKGCEILGYTEKELLGRNWFDHCLPERMREGVKNVFEELLAGKVEPAEYYQNPVLTSAGEERLVAWYNTIIRDREGSIAGTLSSGEDVTERVKTEEALQRAHEELSLFTKTLEKMVEERTSELREANTRLIEAERLATLGKLANKVAHELRNPLMVIGGFAKRMHEKAPDDEPRKRYLRIILKEVELLEERVSEIIKFENEKNLSDGAMD
jgi:PAS domain S-box-containing protein